jgi:hypothetical protein
MICFFQILLHGGVCTVSLDVLLPNVACGANLGGCAVRVGWGPPGGLWAYPKCWTSIRCWGDHGMHLRWWVPGIRGCLHPSGCQWPSSLLEGTSGWRGLFDNPVRPELLEVQGEGSSQWHLWRWRTSCWCVGRTGVLCALLRWKRVWTGVLKICMCCLRAIALGSTVLVMTNELHLN